MTPRQRVLAALDHRQPDRTPVDLSGHRSSGIAAVLYPRLREALGLAPRTVDVYDPVQQLAIVHEDVLDALGIDTIELGRGFCLDDRWWTPWTLPDGTPCRMPAWAAPELAGREWVLRSPGGRVAGRMPEGSLHFDQAWWPFGDDAEDLDRIEELFPEHLWTGMASPPGPSVATPADLAAGARALRRRTGRAIIGLFGGNLLEMGQFHYGMEQFLTMLAGDPARVHRFLDRLVEIHLHRLEQFLGAVGDSIDIILFGDDLGTQRGPQISPRMYREFFQPRHAQLWRRAKQLAPVKVMLHCCGGVRPLLGDLIDAGMDAINPVQIGAKGMDAESLKREFGGAITFWGGGCDTQQVLPFGTPAEVREHVLSQCAALAPGGGFVFQQVHNLLAHVPAENILAMYAAVREYDGRGRSGESMRTGAIALGAAAAACLSAGVAVAQAQEYPQAAIANGSLAAKIYLPDAAKGFYRGTRFDWSGVIHSLVFRGHDFYGPWFDRRDPKIHDFIYDGAAIVTGAASSITGPVEEFTGKPLGYDEAKAGGTFVKIGVGVIRKPEEPRYDNYRAYEIADPGKWTVRRAADSVEFAQELADPSSGYAYVYRKTVRLAQGRPVMTLEHSLRNTGRKAIATDVYDHNFLVLDHLPPGPDFSIEVPFAIHAARPPEGPIEVRGKRIVYTKALAGQDRATLTIEGFGATAADYDIRIENAKLGVGMRITGDRPLVREALWSIRSNVAVEPFIHVSVAPGAETAWTYTYEYYALPGK
jgi:uroporphyrinogen decarboxylase